MSVETSGGAGPSPDGGSAVVGTPVRREPGTEGFFRADGDLLVPAAFATSPWGQVLHGRLIGGLTARAAEQARAESAELACSRLTVDLFRSVPLAPVWVTATQARAGRRIMVLDVTVEQDDGPVGSGRVVLLRRSAQPGGRFRTPPDWGAPTPGELGPPEPMATRRWTPPWESWRVGNGPKAIAGGLWIRDTHPLVTGEQLTPLVRLAMAADLASPVSNSSDLGLSFINADYTVYLGREPRGEHIGIQPDGHLSERGVAAGRCVLHDLDGPVGFAGTAAVANPTLGLPAGTPRRPVVAALAGAGPGESPEARRELLGPARVMRGASLGWTDAPRGGSPVAPNLRVFLARPARAGCIAGPKPMTG